MGTLSQRPRASRALDRSMAEYSKTAKYLQKGWTVFENFSSNASRNERHENYYSVEPGMYDPVRPSTVANSTVACRHKALEMALWFAQRSSTTGRDKICLQQRPQCMRLCIHSQDFRAVSFGIFSLSLQPCEGLTLSKPQLKKICQYTTEARIERRRRQSFFSRRVLHMAMAF